MKTYTFKVALVTVAQHAGGDTFSVKTLQTIIATQARWTEDDVRRLKLIR